THGLVASQRVLLALTERGMARQDAYKIVQSGAMESWATDEPLHDILGRNATVTELLPPDELAMLFDHDYHLKHIDTAFVRLGIGER
ncbi:MAG: adenylosuccinate lyase, partial [Chloroflexota bacterium]|nr:adenylosuccinate lyase [Chloroflexota bacterium]